MKVEYFPEIFKINEDQFLASLFFTHSTPTDDEIIKYIYETSINLNKPKQSNSKLNLDDILEQIDQKNNNIIKLLQNPTSKIYENLTEFLPNNYKQEFLGGIYSIFNKNPLELFSKDLANNEKIIYKNGLENYSEFQILYENQKLPKKDELKVLIKNHTLYSNILQAKYSKIDEMMQIYNLIYSKEFKSIIKEDKTKKILDKESYKVFTRFYQEFQIQSMLQKIEIQ